MKFYDGDDEDRQKIERSLDALADAAHAQGMTAPDIARLVTAAVDLQTASLLMKSDPRRAFEIFRDIVVTMAPFSQRNPPHAVEMAAMLMTRVVSGHPKPEHDLKEYVVAVRNYINDSLEAT